TDETATVEEQQQYIDHIVQSAQELDAIIHKIVDYTY
ncbi:MAG: histidine kinase, partial [Cytophagia bacterium]